MFLTTLSGALVALALIAQATDFGDGFILSALVILPVVLFIGVATVVRLGDSNYHDAICIVGMNRIRHAYLELAPDLAPYFVMGTHDDVRGVSITMAVPERKATLLHVLAATPAVIGVVCAVLAAVIGALVAIELHAEAAAILASAWRHSWSRWRSSPARDDAPSRGDRLPSDRCSRRPPRTDGGRVAEPFRLLARVPPLRRWIG